MAPHSAPASASRKAPTPPLATLAELVEIASKHVSEQLMPMVTRMVGAMLDAGAAGAAPKSTYQRVKSGNLLKNNSYAYFHLAATALDLALRKEIKQLAPAQPAAGAAPAPLGLVPLEEMDSKVAFGAISRPFDIAHAEALALLCVRLGSLLGRGILRGEQNPFRPEVFLCALDEAWRQFEPDAAGHGLVVPLLRPSVVFDFAPVLESLTQALTRKDGRADAINIRKTSDAAANKAARAGRDAALAQQLRQLFGAGDAGAGAQDSAIPLIPDLPGMPQGTGGWRPSGAAGFAMQPASAAPAAPVTAALFDARPGAQAAAAHVGPHVAAPLIDLLAQMPAQRTGATANVGESVLQNVFYLPRLKQSLPAGSLTRGDETTLDLLSRIFETVLLDENIPKETRELIQFLQVPVLKAALLDKNFFFEEAHPARRMIDLLSRMEWDGPKGADDPLFRAMRHSVDRLGSGQGGQPEAFAAAVAELEASIADQERAAEAAIAAPIASALKQEKRAAARRSARDAVALRVGAGDVAAAVGAFLEQRWSEVLTLAYSIDDDKPGAVGNATRAMDDLLWSVKPKATQEQRKALIAKLPGLLATLNKWLDIIKWQDATRLQFFAELAGIHASIVRAPLDLSPERQLELALEAAQQDALRRVAQENAAAANAAQAAVNASASALDGLERGMRLEFSGPGGGVRKVRLAWVSPLRTLFIFSDGSSRHEAFSMPADKLAAALASGMAHVVALDGVVGRVLSQALQQAA